jgi:hypothetical protein
MPAVFALLMTLLMVAGCAPSYENQLARIDARLESLERRVENTNQHAQAAASSAALCDKPAPPPPPAAPPTPLPKPWSCAANCVTSYNCTTNGTSNVKWKAITSTGATAAEAFSALDDQCGDEMYVDGQCVGGKWTRTAATIVNACTHN